MAIQATSTLTFILNILIVLIYFWARVSANKDSCYCCCCCCWPHYVHNWGSFRSLFNCKMKNWYILVFPPFFSFLHITISVLYNHNIIISWLLPLKSYYHSFISRLIVFTWEPCDYFTLVLSQWTQTTQLTILLGTCLSSKLYIRRNTHQKAMS